MNVTVISILHLRTKQMFRLCLNSVLPQPPPKLRTNPFKLLSSLNLCLLTQWLEAAKSKAFRNRMNKVILQNTAYTGMTRRTHHDGVRYSYWFEPQIPTKSYTIYNTQSGKTNILRNFALPMSCLLSFLPILFALHLSSEGILCSDWSIWCLSKTQQSALQSSVHKPNPD